MADIIQKRRDTAANFTAANTLLAQGEEAYELDTGFEKRGDGVTLWNALPYLSSGGGSGTVESVTGDGVNNTDPANPVISFPTATDIGLGNVDNTSDADKPVSTAQGTAISTAENNAKAYADTLVVNLWDDRGSFSAAGGAYPSTGGSGPAGAIKRGDIWTISVAGTLPTGQSVEVGDLVRALIDTPGNTQANWAITQNNIGYTAENQSNKATDLTSPDNVKYPTTQAVATAIGAVTVSDASETVKGIAEVSTDAEAFTTADNLIMTPLKVRNRIRTKTTGTTSFSIDSANDQRTVQVSPPGAIVCTINSAAEDVIVQILNFGAGSVGFTAGIGVTITGIATLTSNKGAVIKYTSATTAVVMGGSTITFANVTSKPTTVAGYGITDASKAIFATGATVSSVGTTETTLATGNIPANTLATDLGHLRAVFVGQFGASANNKTLKVKLGATTIFDSAAIPVVGAIDFEFQIKIMRTAAAAQRGSVTLYSNSGTVAGVKYFTATEDLTTLLALAVTGTVASPGGTEISGHMFYAVKEGI